MDLGRGGRPTRRAMKASVEVLGQIEAEPDSRLATSTAEELNPARHSRHGSCCALVGPVAVSMGTRWPTQDLGRGPLLCERSDAEQERTPADDNGSESRDPDDDGPPRT
jgi:hypothetical protein